LPLAAGRPAAAADAKSGDAKSADATRSDAKAGEETDPEKIDWSKVDWRKKLTRMQYYVTRQAGTERAFKNKYWNFFKEGEYRCVSCGLPLFKSTAKFDSECGWPSFDQAIAEDTVTQHEDLTLLEPRIEIRCRRCQAHLGHVFNDGPTDTGLRYCMNSVAMTFVSAKQLEKEKAEQQSGGAEKGDKEKPAPPADEPAPPATEKP
jgi:methionine-R-sulfoxide reductase